MRRIPPLPKLNLGANWPFSVTSLPFFYGWAVLFVSTLGLLMSIPGQTVGMAIFTDQFIEHFGLSRTELSLAYLLGTVSSAVFLTRAGRLYDRIGARFVMVGSSILLGLALCFIACIDLIAAALAPLSPFASATIVFPLIWLGYFGVRFAGQGVLSGAATNVLLVWFDRRRGIVSGVRAVFATLGFSMAPVVLAWMIATESWRGALLTLAVIVGIGFSTIALLIVRDTPESCGLVPDGHRHGTGHASSGTIPDVTVTTARRSAVFWIYSLVLALYGLFITGVVFHIVAIFAEAGRTSAEAFAYFFPAAMISVAVNVLGSWLADRVPLKWLLMFELVGFIAGTWGLLSLDQTWGYWTFIAGIGIASGLWGVLSNLSFIRFFGRRYLGEISGLNMTLSVIGSAIGPALFSLGNDVFGSYHAGSWVTLLLSVVLLLFAMVIKQVEPRRVSEDFA